jgi:4-hydroxybenzoate polyprenyltransferase
MISTYIRLLRPIAWITFLFPFTVGLGLGVNPESNWFHFLFSYISFSGWMSFSFIVNSIKDIDVDKLHDGRSKDMNLSFQPLSTGEISIKKAYIVSIFSLIISLIFGFLINQIFFYLIIIVNVIGYIYSMPPFRFKAKPISDIICNASAGGLIFIAGLNVGGDNINLLMIIGSFIMSAIFYIPTVVTDFEFDNKAGLKTSAVYFRPKRLLKGLYPLTIIFIILSIVILLTSNIELQILALIGIFYTIPSSIVVNRNIVDDRLYIHQNWILLPFGVFSIIYTFYGILKIVGLLSFN